MITVIDYGRGNLFSIGQALRHLDAVFEVSAEPEAIAAADRIIFPGVGAFADAMTGLRERGLVAPLKAAAHGGTPILGICVGCQLMLSRSEEFGDHAGLDLIPGTVARLPAPRADDAAGIRIPNVGWRRMDTRADAVVLSAVGADEMMYFVHSYPPTDRRRDHHGQWHYGARRDRTRCVGRRAVSSREKRSRRPRLSATLSGDKIRCLTTACRK